MSLIHTSRNVCSELQDQYFSILKAKDIIYSSELESSRNQLYSEWENLELDQYLQSGDRFRYRRFGLFELNSNRNQITPACHAAYHQSKKINRYAGGIDRKFQSLSTAALNNQFLLELMWFDYSLLPSASKKTVNDWVVDVHQIRIIGMERDSGKPTPEGIHQDGEQFVFTHLIDLHNAHGGESRIYNHEGSLLIRHSLENPLDTLVLWDSYVLHDVSDIKPLTQGMPARRDVLLMGFDPA